jgi:hypothetical protein
MAAASSTIIMAILIILFIIALILLAQLNCFIERRREMARREIQNLRAQRTTSSTNKAPTASS